jgi:hypothetical protein
MASFTISMASGPEDLQDLEKIWPTARLGSFNDSTCGSLSRDALRNGQLFILRDGKGEVAGATAVDWRFSDRALYVPFIAVDTTTAAGAIGAKTLLEAVVRIGIQAPRVDRILFAMTTAEIPDGAIEVFNDRLAGAKINLHLEPLGRNRDLFGDGRDVTIAALFIPQQDRPDVSAATVGAIARGVSKAAAAAQGESQLLAEACCSGCSEKTSKDGKENGKDKEDKEFNKEGKDGKDDFEGPDGALGDKLAPEKSAIDTVPDLIRAYSDAGVEVPAGIARSVDQLLV